jgi:hypothetical protein
MLQRAFAFQNLAPVVARPVSARCPIVATLSLTTAAYTAPERVTGPSALPPRDAAAKGCTAPVSRPMTGADLTAEHSCGVEQPPQPPPLPTSSVAPHDRTALRERGSLALQLYLARGALRLADQWPTGPFVGARRFEELREIAATLDIIAGKSVALLEVADEHLLSAEKKVGDLTTLVEKERRMKQQADEVIVKLDAGNLVREFESVVVSIVVAKLGKAERGCFEGIKTLPHLLKVAENNQNANKKPENRDKPLPERPRILSLIDFVFKELLYSRVQGVARHGADTTALTEQVLKLIQKLRHVRDVTAHEGTRVEVLARSALTTAHLTREGGNPSPQSVVVIIDLFNAVVHADGDTIKAAVRSFVAATLARPAQ